MFIVLPVVPVPINIIPLYVIPLYVIPLYVIRMRQDSEHTRAVARVRLRCCPSERADAACSTAHTAPQRSWNRRRCSAKETVSVRWWRERQWARSSSWAEQKRGSRPV